MRQTLAGLAHIHAQGIIHRDLKPDNIFFDARGDIKCAMACMLNGGCGRLQDADIGCSKLRRSLVVLYAALCTRTGLETLGLQSTLLSAASQQHRRRSEQLLSAPNGSCMRTYPMLFHQGFLVHCSTSRLKSRRCASSWFRP